MEEFVAKLCNVFGYINATEEDVILLECEGGEFTPTYIKIDLHQVIIEFIRKDYTWTMREV